MQLRKGETIVGKVQIIQKSRKEYKCSKCGKTIPAGSKYYKGEINFGPTIIRCNDCKLESWEVTTSDYLLRVGQILYKWQEDYEVNEDTASDISSSLQEIEDDLQERLDNMPEGLQEGDAGQLLQERIDALEDAISELDCIDIDDIKSDVFDEYFTDMDDHSFESFDDAIEFLENQNDPKSSSKVDELNNLLEEKIVEAIDEALSCLEC